MDEKFTKGGPIPVGVGSQADLYAEVRDLRLQMQKATDEVKARETEIYNTILSYLTESTDTGAAGKTHRVQLVTKKRQHVKDWPTVWGFIRQNNLFELLQKRLSDTAAKEFEDTHHQPVPGVETVEVQELSFNKI